MLASADATTIGDSASTKPEVSTWNGRSPNRCRAGGPPTNSATPTPTSIWLTTKNAAAPARTGASAPPMSATGGSWPSRASTSAAAASDNPYWPALKATFSALSRARTSASAEAAA